MLLIYTIVYFLSIVFYKLNLNIIASCIMIALAIFLYVMDFLKTKHLINVRGLFALGFVGGFGLSLLKLSILSADYSLMTILVVFSSYFSLSVGTFFAEKYKKDVKHKKRKIERTESILNNQEILIIILLAVSFLAFLVEVIKLKFVPLFTIATPHAYSTFHVFGLHYITTFYVFVPCIALCNIFVDKNKRSVLFFVISCVYMVVMSLLLVSRAQLIQSLILMLFVFLVYKTGTITQYLVNPKSLVVIISSLMLFIILYLIITINRAHDVNYLNGIFEMKNEKMPIFITQPYMYIAHNFENLNYMINNTFRWTFGRRVLYPFFTLTLIKKFFPIVVDAPYYVIKEELSTVTIVYDFYYDFGLIGVIIFCGLIGYLGKKLENKTYDSILEDNFDNNNYIVVFFALYAYFMLFSFFQAYFSLTDTWVHFIFLFIIIVTVQMTKKYKNYTRPKKEVKIIEKSLEEKNIEDVKIEDIT